MNRNIQYGRTRVAVAGLLAASATSVFSAEPELTLAGDWSVRVSAAGLTGVLEVRPPDRVEVADERYDRLAPFEGPVWRRGTLLRGLRAEECSVADALEPASVVLRTGPGEAAAALARDTAYFADLGYRLDTLRAFDAFPMTHHVECVALLTKSGPA